MITASAQGYLFLFLTMLLNRMGAWRPSELLFCNIYHPSCPPPPAHAHEQLVTHLIWKPRLGPYQALNTVLAPCVTRELILGCDTSPGNTVGSYLGLSVMWLGHRLPSIQRLLLSWQCWQGMPLAFAPPAVPPCELRDSPHEYQVQQPNR